MRVRPELRRAHEGLATQLFQLRATDKSIIFEVGLALFLELFLCGTDAVRRADSRAAASTPSRQCDDNLKVGNVRKSRRVGTVNESRNAHHRGALPKAGT